MRIEELTSALDYAGNPNFLAGDALARANDYAHIFRSAAVRMNLRGVYALNQPPSKQSNRETIVPIVYVCEAATESEAVECRRLTWNQNASPFVIVKTPTRIRLFSSFNYSVGKSSTPQTLDRAIEFEQIATELTAFSSRAIDQGAIWKDFGWFVTPQQRVDWTLLDSLEKLDAHLIDSELDWRTSHALIGKYVYLWYLRQREILSDGRLDEWGINKDHLFSQNATLVAFKETFGQLDNWLNGSIFPLDWTRENAPKQHHLRKVAAVFAGDTIDGQLHLPFDAYDFSVIPVETLSAIYERFLHAHEPKNKTSRGKELGAYYTPVSVVNFMLEELDDKRPLEQGMTCFDASCGSGAFLVQCYRRLIENKVRQDGLTVRPPRELRDILEQSIFGVDRDEDACRVTELSLILTLLDYVKPPDLLPVGKYKHVLPDLHNKNIFQADFFDPESLWASSAIEKQFDWVVGNPPWVEVKPPKPDDEDKDENADARKWIADNSHGMPVSGNQLAEAFLWKVTKHLKQDGLAGMLVPAMTLFKNQSRLLRKAFFKRLDVWCIVNFANLAESLFAKRSREPAAAFFYSLPPKTRRPEEDNRMILTYSPFVVNQEANRPVGKSQREDTWSITVNGSEVRSVPINDAATGDALVWKLAMWGSDLDGRLLASVARRFETLDAMGRRLQINIHAGVELRKKRESTGADALEGAEAITFVKELEDKWEILTPKLRGCGRIYSFPDNSLIKISKERANVRAGRDVLPVVVSRPPHVIVDAARRFAVYSEEFIAVPHAWVGIAGTEEQAELLKALALYLVSDFGSYHQFLISPEMGIYKSKADLKALRQLPIPIDNICRQGLGMWSELYHQLALASLRPLGNEQSHQPSLYSNSSESTDISRVEAEVNALVYEALRLRKSEIAIVSDLVHQRRHLIQGKVDRLVTGSPTENEMRCYCELLKRQLDAFFEVATELRHTIDVVYEDASAMIVVDRGKALPMQQSVKIIRAGDAAAFALQRVRDRITTKHRQWMYFSRDLRKYQNGTTYLFKPMQRIHWLPSQALVDAGEAFADRTGGKGI
ncbi:MAG TPA: N-6 DNA methylase [Tepidisphaeraceae bacterium]|jgi:hypothetical protein|nr:N-6 DNA methylase [Tepidisphaeraceae bacterium]